MRFTTSPTSIISLEFGKKGLSAELISENGLSIETIVNLNSQTFEKGFNPIYCGATRPAFRCKQLWPKQMVCVVIDLHHARILQCLTKPTSILTPENISRRLGNLFRHVIIKSWGYLVPEEAPEENFRDQELGLAMMKPII